MNDDVLEFHEIGIANIINFQGTFS